MFILKGFFRKIFYKEKYDVFKILSACDWYADAVA
jgi:hypothetical protein